MEYPKKIMGISELTKIGFSRNELLVCSRIKDQVFARKTFGGGKWLFDTELFEAWRNSNGRI